VTNKPNSAKRVQQLVQQDFESKHSGNRHRLGWYVLEQRMTRYKMGKIIDNIGIQTILQRVRNTVEDVIQEELGHPF